MSLKSVFILFFTGWKGYVTLTPLMSMIFLCLIILAQFSIERKKVSSNHLFSYEQLKHSHKVNRAFICIKHKITTLLHTHNLNTPWTCQIMCSQHNIINNHTTTTTLIHFFKWEIKSFFNINWKLQLLLWNYNRTITRLVTCWCCWYS